MLFSGLITSVFLVATVTFAAPVPTNELSKHSVELAQANLAMEEARIQGKYQSLKLKDSLYQGRPHHEGQRKRVHNKEHMNTDEEEEELQKRRDIWSKPRKAVKVPSSSGSRNTVKRSSAKFVNPTSFNLILANAPFSPKIEIENLEDGAFANAHKRVRTGGGVKSVARAPETAAKAPSSSGNQNPVNNPSTKFDFPPMLTNLEPNEPFSVIQSAAVFVTGNVPHAN